MAELDFIDQALDYDFHPKYTSIGLYDSSKLHKSGEPSSEIASLLRWHFVGE